MKVVRKTVEENINKSLETKMENKISEDKTFTMCNK